MLSDELSMENYEKNDREDENRNIEGEHLSMEKCNNPFFRPRFETTATCASSGEDPSLHMSLCLSSSLQPIPEAKELQDEQPKKTSVPTIHLERNYGFKSNNINRHHSEPINEGPSSHLLRRKEPLYRHGSLILDGKREENGHTSLNGSVKMGRRQSIRQSFRSNLMPLKARFSNRRVRNRLVQKNGLCNISLVNVPSQSQKFISDIFTTLVDVKWRWVILAFVTAFITSWLTFSLIFYLICLFHGDFEESVLNGNVTDWTPCIMNMENYASVFLYTFESQTTIGYGFRYPTELCPPIIIGVCAQNMYGVILQALMAGVVFAKLARPKKRAETLVFSKNGVICMRDSKLCFLFRIGDMRKSHLLEAHIRLQLIKKRITAEGELLPFHQFDMHVGFDTGLDRIFVMWPITICHVIDEDSPLYDLSADALLNDARFEILVILEGVVESTGATTQARTSYIPSEVLWGHRFEKLITFQRDNGAYRIDFSRFHSTYPVATPPFSQKELDEMMECGLHPTDAYKWNHIEQVENMGNTPYATVQHATSPLRPHISSLFSINNDTHHGNVSDKERLVNLMRPEDKDRSSSPVSVESFDGTFEDNKKKVDEETGGIGSIGKMMRESGVLTPPATLDLLRQSAKDKKPDAEKHAKSPVKSTKSPEGQKGRKSKNLVLKEHDIM